MNRRKFCRMAGASLVAAVLAPLSFAQAKWPDKPIRLIVPYTPGGGTDTLARLVADKIGASAKWTIVVENKPGGGGKVAMAQTTYIQDDIAQGRLIALFDSPLKTERSYYAVYSREKRGDRRILAFTSWLKNEFSGSLAHSEMAS